MAKEEPAEERLTISVTPLQVSHMLDDVEFIAFLESCPDKPARNMEIQLKKSIEKCLISIAVEL